MVSELLLSIIQNYFSGLLLFWELNPSIKDEEKWDPLWGTSVSKNPLFAVLDGQQRLASLFYVIYGPERHFPRRKSYYNFFLDIEKYLDKLFDDETIFYKTSTKYLSLDSIKEKKDEWIKDCILPLRIFSDEKFVDNEFSTRWAWEYAEQFSNDELDLRKKYTEILTVKSRLLGYEFITHTLGKERELPDICGIFARINQKGLRLSTFDLMNAFLYPKGISLKKLWEEVDDILLKEADYSMNEYLLKLMSLYKQEYCSSKYIYYLIPGSRVKKKDIAGNTVEVVLINDAKNFISLWEKSQTYAIKSVEKIINVGKTDFGAIKQKFIPNTTIIPVMGSILMEFEENFKDNIKEDDFYNILYKWYWSSVISGDYSGSTDSVMSEDYRDLKKWLKEGDSTIIRRIGKIDKEFLDNLDLINCKRGSALYNAILSLIAINKAEDFYTLRQLGTGTYIEEGIHDHHIFPTGIKEFPDNNATKFKDSKDSILNRTLLFDITNVQIKAKRPSLYLSEMKTKLNIDEKRIFEIMFRHFIDEVCLDSLEHDQYDLFILNREKGIKNRLKKLFSL